MEKRRKKSEEVSRKEPEKAGLTLDMVEKIEKELDRVIEKKKLPAALRLAFHDCVGGCDGCLNVHNEANTGLQPFMKTLDNLYKAKQYANVLSRADFWALASVYAVRKTVELNNQLCRMIW